MNLVNILYEPYFIIIVLSLIIVLITYFLIKDEKKLKNPEEEKKKMSVSKRLLYTFLISFIILIGIHLLFKNLNKGNSAVQSGGAAVDFTERLTMAADDVEFGILEN
jgi:uncharacterized membrane protein